MPPIFKPASKVEVPALPTKILWATENCSDGVVVPMPTFGPFEVLTVNAGTEEVVVAMLQALMTLFKMVVVAALPCLIVMPVDVAEEVVAIE